MRKIKFKYSDVFKEYCCCIDGYVYAWEAHFPNAGPRDWIKDGYIREWAEWFKKRGLCFGTVMVK